jgi:hypothetical protein
MAMKTCILADVVEGPCSTTKGWHQGVAGSCRGGRWWRPSHLARHGGHPTREEDEAAERGLGSGEAAPLLASAVEPFRRLAAPPVARAIGRNTGAAAAAAATGRGAIGGGGGQPIGEEEARGLSL